MDRDVQAGEPRPRTQGGAETAHDGVSPLPRGQDRRTHIARKGRPRGPWRPPIPGLVLPWHRWTLTRREAPQKGPGPGWSVAKSPSGSLHLAGAGPVPSWERGHGSRAEALTQIFYAVLN